jgi:membrane-bound lytic murein transglycosylase A
VYGTPFFIEADLPLKDENQGVRFEHLMIAQDTGSAIVGPARADIFWGAGERAGQVASHVHHFGNVAVLVPRDIDPVGAGARMPLPPQRPPLPAEAKAKVGTKAGTKTGTKAGTNTGINTRAAKSSGVQPDSMQLERSMRGSQDVPKSHDTIRSR